MVSKNTSVVVIGIFTITFKTILIFQNSVEYVKWI